MPSNKLRKLLESPLPWPEELGADTRYSRLHDDAFSLDRCVPSLGCFAFDLELLKKLAEGPSLVPGANHMREGIVVRPAIERTSDEIGRVILKLVSNEYLEKAA